MREKNGLSYFDRLLSDLYIVSNSSESEEIKMPERKISDEAHKIQHIMNKNLKKQVKIVRLGIEAENNFYERQMKVNKQKKIAKEVKAYRDII